MNQHHKKRTKTIIIAVVIFAVAVGLIAFALRKNIDLYMTPSQLIASPVTDQQIVLGGVVTDVHYDTAGLSVKFEVVDAGGTVKVQYTGTLPALFREGQQTIVVGHRTADAELLASRIYAKHDQYYRPAKDDHHVA